VNHRPELLHAALRKAGVLEGRERIEWRSPLEVDSNKEYRDKKALSMLDLATPLKVPLETFWPAMGPAWDGLAVTSKGRPVLVEAKAHIAEAASPRSKASPESLKLIQKSLNAARSVMARRSKADWSGMFYQYANRLAFQDYLRRINGIDSRLVFLNFVNAADVEGPSTEEEWHGAMRIIHAVLGLPRDLTKFGVFHAYVDAKLLMDTKRG
jgi:hypothetical protein